MDLPVESWLRAASVRQSTRSFARKALDRDQRDRLEQVCREFRPYPEARATGFSGGWEFLESPEVARFRASVISSF